MTNEQLATFIQQGEFDEGKPILWERVRKLLYMKSEQVFKLYEIQCSKSGVDVWDIKQVSYTAFLDAVKAYKSDSGNKFSSYLNYPFKNAVNELLGLRTSRAINEPLNNCSSLDKPIEQSDGNTLTLADMLQDETAQDFVDDIDRHSEAETVRQIVGTLSEPHRSVIQAYFFEGLTLQGIAEKLNVNRERVRQIEAKALRILRQNTELRQLYCEQRHHYNWLRLSRFQYSPEYYDVISRVEECRLSYGQRQAELNTAFCQWEQENRDF